jgi:hypothetical protein
MRSRIYKDRTGRSRSGPNIPEGQRRTMRIRISALAFALAQQRATNTGVSVAKAIEDVLVHASATHGSDQPTRNEGMAP